jgi:hypothetical protein
MSDHISPSLSSRLVALGIPAEKQTIDNLCALLPFSDFSRTKDINALAEMVLYLQMQKFISVRGQAWKLLPWGSHHCLFYRNQEELFENLKEFFEAGLFLNELCVWVVPKAMRIDIAHDIAKDLIAKTGARPGSLQVFQHEEWYEDTSGRFRGVNVMLELWAAKLKEAESGGYAGLRVTGDVPQPEFKDFELYEDRVQLQVPNLKLKALCSYPLAGYSSNEVARIALTHGQAYGGTPTSQPVDSSVKVAGQRLGNIRHLCAFFDGKDEERRVLGAFIHDGIVAGEKAVHIVDPNSKEDHVRWLRNLQIDVNSAMADKQLEILSWQDAYLKGNYFDQARQTMLLHSLLERSREEGFPLTRLVANMEWALENLPGVHTLVEYECRLNYMLPQYADPVICTYDIRRFSSKTLIEIMRVHPVVIIGDKVQENPFYVPPDQYLKENGLTHSCAHNKRLELAGHE